MIQITLSILALVAATVVVHSIGLTWLLRHVSRNETQIIQSSWLVMWLLIRTVWSLLLIHAIEISLWALFFVRSDLMPSVESALYFSGVTYTTLGYGDLVLPAPWRLLGPVEGLTGILMCALSGAFFFTIFSRILVHRDKA